MVCDQVIDSYDGDKNATYPIEASNKYCGQAFTMGGTGRTICGAKFYLDNNASGPNITVEARIYACTGTVGTNGQITGAALATSTSQSFNTVQGAAWVEFTFLTPYALSANTDYCLVLYCSARTSPAQIDVWSDASSPSHGGNFCFLGGTNNGWDNNFYAYSEPFSDWTGIILGVTNPAKVNEIAKANISKINGV